MAADTNWVSILGAVSGVSALIIWLASLIISTVRKPKLQISSKPYARLWEIEDALTGVKHTWNFVNFEVKNKKGLALGCEAKAIVVKHPNDVSLVRELTKDGYGIHWADISYSGRSTSVERIDIGSVTQRLDVVFTAPNQSGQSFLAMPIALSTMWDKGKCVNQAILPQGEYIIKVRVTCANGKGDSKTIKLISPNDWQQLKAEIV